MPEPQRDETLSPELHDQMLRLQRGTLDIVPAGGLAAKLLKSQKTGKPLKIKLGLDPTAPDIHLGFAVVLRKLRQFQDLGHQVIIIIGDYTALIGDPSGRSVTRPMLSAEAIASNAVTYIDQLARILDRDKTQVRYNSEWLGKLGFAEVVQLAARMTVAQVMQREDFASRFAQHQPIGLHELLVADDPTKRLIQERARVADLFASAVEGGMRTLKMDGMEKVMLGLTDLKMVRSVCIK